MTTGARKETDVDSEFYVLFWVMTTSAASHQGALSCLHFIFECRQYYQTQRTTSDTHKITLLAEAEALIENRLHQVVAKLKSLISGGAFCCLCVKDLVSLPV